MKYIYLLSIIVFICGCGNNFYGHIEQSIGENATSGGSCKYFRTYVWWKNDIVWIRYDSTCGLTDSIVKLSQQQASIVLDALRKSK